MWKSDKQRRFLFASAAGKTDMKPKSARDFLKDSGVKPIELPKFPKFESNPEKFGKLKSYLKGKK